VLAAETTLAGLEARRARLREIVNGYKQGMYELAGTSIQHDALVREVKENEDNYLLYANKREEARIEESLNRQRITNVAVVEAPSLPAEPAGPKIPLDLALGAVVSALFAYAVIKLALEFAPGLLGVSHGPQVVREALAS
jgi:uncharacterized protein involved in exopolysaccharide biosynthesis